MKIKTANFLYNKSLFFYLVLISFFFLLLEISFFIQCNSAYLADFRFVSHNLTIPTAILPAFGFFILAQLIIHILYAALIWLMTISICYLLNISARKEMEVALILWALGVLTALTANQYLFPNAKFAELTGLILFNKTLTLAVFVPMLIASAGASLLAVMGLLKRNPLTISLLLVLILSGGFYSYHYRGEVKAKPIANFAYPNIILIGVDSLRPDYLSYFGFDKSTPFFDTFLNQATVFSDAVTPLARTFPSWTAILTGQYPKQNGVRFNLANQTQTTFSNSLPAILRKNGYETIFATDETRFSNIDYNYGFDRIITPPMGLNDFLIGTFNDFPFSNLLINTRLGQAIFPFNYANRPVYFTYDPDSFIQRLQPLLSEKRKQPLFLSVHFCLTHYPYLWKNLGGNHLSVPERYVASIQRVDKQISDFYHLLQQNHLLDHSIVVLLSDHGEALEFPGDRITERELFVPAYTSPITPPRFYPPSADREDFNQSAGHGTDVLSLTQYHTLLAFRLYGMQQQQVKEVIPGAVSLIDIKPTLLELVHLACPDSSGDSLAKALIGPNNFQPALKHIFLESDYSPQSLRTVHPETEKVVMDGIELFQIDPISTRLYVKAEMGKMIIESKQYADIYGDWMLALYPQDKHNRMPILVNLETGHWTNDLHSHFAQLSPAALMLDKLKAFYGTELTTNIRS